MLNSLFHFIIHFCPCPTHLTIQPLPWLQVLNKVAVRAALVHHVAHQRWLAEILLVVHQRRRMRILALVVVTAVMVVVVVATGWHISVASAPVIRRHER